MDNQLSLHDLQPHAQSKPELSAILEFCPILPADILCRQCYN